MRVSRLGVRSHLRGQPARSVMLQGELFAWRKVTLTLFDRLTRDEAVRGSMPTLGHMSTPSVHRHTKRNELQTPSRASRLSPHHAWSVRARVGIARCLARL